MKYLVFGVNGMAGHMIAQYLKECGHCVIGVARSESPVCPVISGDVRDSSVIDAIDFQQYDFVINCVGILNKSVDENPVEGIFLNSLFPHILAERTEDTHTKVIHISTDCVFRGDRGSYTEDDIPDAVTLYGRSKCLGELNDSKNMTIRTSIVGPELKNGIGLFNWFMHQEREVNGYRRVFWGGVTTLQLAKAIEELSQTDIFGLIHLTNNDKIDKCSLLNLFNDRCRKNPIRIIPKDELVSDRSLMSTRADVNVNIPSYQTMIVEMKEWMDRHQALYQQYASI